MAVPIQNTTSSTLTVWLFNFGATKAGTTSKRWHIALLLLCLRGGRAPAQTGRRRGFGGGGKRPAGGDGLDWRPKAKKRICRVASSV